MLRRVKADLHVHTCLSPCGDLLMSPQKITAKARSLDIGIIAICDHNTAENVAAVATAAEGRGVVVLPGMEVCSREEIHVLAIFDAVAPAIALQSVVYAHLNGKNDPDVFGMQVVADADDQVVAYQDTLLIGAVNLPVDQIVDEIHRLGGIAVASHIDRESFSVVSQLGFIPASLAFDALELSPHITDQDARDRFGASPGCRFIRNSDAHFLAELGVNTSDYVLAAPTFSEILKALRGEDGRMVCLP